MFLAVVLALVSIHQISAGCTTTCPEYKGVCGFMKKIDQKQFTTTNSFNCTNSTRDMVDSVFKDIRKCKLTEAAIGTNVLLNMPWDSLPEVKSFMADPDLWKPKCDMTDLATAMCLYLSLPDPNQGEKCDNAVMTRSTFFCPDECPQLFRKCINTTKYTILDKQIDVMCEKMSSTKNSSSCFSAKVSANGTDIGTPVCEKPPKQKSLAGPYVVGGIALTVGVIALLGIILVTCRTGSKAGTPNSF